MVRAIIKESDKNGFRGLAATTLLIVIFGVASGLAGGALLWIFLWGFASVGVAAAIKSMAVHNKVMDKLDD